MIFPNSSKTNSPKKVTSQLWWSGTYWGHLQNNVFSYVHEIFCCCCCKILSLTFSFRKFFKIVDCTRTYCTTVVINYTFYYIFFVFVFLVELETQIYDKCKFVITQVMHSIDKVENNDMGFRCETVGFSEELNLYAVEL